MRVTYIHQHFKKPTEAGGIRSWEFSKRLLRDGHAVTIISGGTETKRYVIDGISVVQIGTPYRNDMSFVRRVMSFLSFMLRATFASVRIKSDLVFATSTPLTVAVPGLIASGVRRVPFVFEVRDLWPSVPIELGLLKNPVLISLANILERITYRRADCIIALSPGMAEGVHRVAPAARVVVVPNACDFDLFDLSSDDREAVRAKHGWGDDEVILVYAGSFGSSYNVEWAVDLFEYVRPQNIRIVIYGEGALTPMLRERAAAYGGVVEEILPGLLPKEEVAKVVAASDGVISTLVGDLCLEVNSLNKVFDSMAASKPVLFNHGGWLAELVVEGRAGWRFSRDVCVAAEEIREIGLTRELLREFGRRNREIGREHFDREQLYLVFRKALESVALADN